MRAIETTVTGTVEEVEPAVRAALAAEAAPSSTEGARHARSRVGGPGASRSGPGAGARQQRLGTSSAQPGGAPKELLRIGLGVGRDPRRFGLDHHRHRSQAGVQPAHLPLLLPRRLREGQGKGALGPLARGVLLLGSSRD